MFQMSVGTFLPKQNHHQSMKGGNVKSPSKVFLDFVINEHTSPRQYNRIMEGYTVLDVQNYLFHLKDSGWMKEFQWK